MPARYLYLTLIFSLTALFCSPLIADGLYKWVDGNGVVHYSQTPPNNGKAEALDIKTGNIKSDTATASPEAQKIIDEVNKKAEEKKSEQAIAYEQNCTIAKDNLLTLNTNSRVLSGKKDENGKDLLLTKDEIQEKVAEVKQQIAQFCVDAAASSDS